MKGFSRSHLLSSGYIVHRPQHKVVAFHLAALTVICLLAAVTAVAQETPRFEIGGGLSVLNHGRKANVGPGFTGVFNISRYLSLEGSLNWFPTEAGFTFENPFLPANPAVETSAAQGLFGAKVGYRTNKFGAFVKVRPGLISTPKTERASGIIANLIGGSVPTQRLGRLTEKAFDLGGVFEYYPAKHWAVRADAGDTLIFEEGEIFVDVDNISGTTTTRKFGAATTGHFQFTISGMFRF
jgi:hypothetical protein